jgi:exopolyphosphatase/guanosine-5'-triphosphate,3'-diphosphate pyrophosphatase
MILGAIDIGTNTIRLLIAEVVGDNLKDIQRQAIITRLGQGVDKTGRFSSEAMERTLEVIADYKKVLEEVGVESVRVVATSAARDAENGQEFVDELKKRFGFDVLVLSGMEEAMWAYLGATSDFPFPKPYSRPVVIDVGGGSTELAYGQGMSLQKIYSLDIGSVRLTEMFIKKDPPSQTEIEGIRGYVREKVTSPIEEIVKADSELVAIGVAGTITTLSAIKQRMEVYDSSKIHLSTLTMGEIKEILNQLINVSLEDRKKIPGLEPKRADVIIAGTLITLEILKELGLEKVTVSEHDLLDGLIWIQVPGIRTRTL